MPSSPPASTFPGLSKLILGSKSWSRRHLLSALYPTFSTVVPDIDERSIKAATPQSLVLAIGKAKAKALLERNAVSPAEDGKTILVCGDAVVTHKGATMGKPKDKSEARKWLKSYASAPVTTVSSVVVVDVALRRMWSGVDEAEVYFREIPDDVVEELLDEGCLESAGALRIEHPQTKRFAECVVGDISAVMGFSQPLFLKLIKQALEGGEGDAIEAS